MSDDRWRTRLRWVVVHPHDPAVLLARRDGVLALPETERPGQVWTADPAEVLPALGELLGADALLLDCLDDHQDPAAGVQRATLLAVPREAPAPAQGMAWVGRAGLAGAGAGQAAVAAPGGRGAGARPRRGRRPALGGPRLVRRGRALAALDHGAPRPAPHRAGAPGPGLASRPGVWPGPGSWPPRWAPCTRRSATGPWPPGRRETPTWPSRPPGGSARCWPAWRDRRHRGTVPHGTAWPPPAAADCREMHRGKVGRWSWRRPRPHCRS